MVFELNLIAVKLVLEEALVDVLQYHAAPDLALYFILPKLNVDTSMVIEKK